MHSRGEWKSFAGRTGQTFKMKMIENIDFSMDIFTCYTYCQYMKKKCNSGKKLQKRHLLQMQVWKKYAHPPVHTVQISPGKNTWEYWPVN